MRRKSNATKTLICVYVLISKRCLTRFSSKEGGGLGISDDEDEKDLDRLELEDGDLDDIDESEEREKVGRIHQRVLLDEDQADLRLFQERFLEDGDLHTDYKRQRQFKWNGLDDDIEVPEE